MYIPTLTSLTYLTLSKVLKKLGLGGKNKFQKTNGSPGSMLGEAKGGEEEFWIIVSLPI